MSLKNPLFAKNWIIDGNGIIMRYFFAMDEMLSSDGIQIHGFFGFIKCLLNILQDHHPLSILVTFDKCYDNFRKEIDPGYKSNRPKIDNNAVQQINMCLEFCKSFSIPVEFHTKYEADDLIASHVYQNPEKSFIIMSTDKDLCQLVNDNVFLFNPFYKKLIKSDDVYLKYGVTPQLFDIFLALQGDSSDNVKGIPGVGPKTAAKILQTTTNLNEIPKLFPKFDFTDLNTQIKLVTLIKDIPLMNSKTMPLDLNLSNGNSYLECIGVDLLSTLFNRFAINHQMNQYNK